jgi:hypothetical protein
MILRAVNQGWGEGKKRPLRPILMDWKNMGKGI